MLVLKRKTGQRTFLTVKVGGECVRITVTVTEIDKGAVKIGFDAPHNTEIMREELVAVPTDLKPKE